MKQNLLIVTGLPYSGKTTLTKKLVDKYHYKTASVDKFINQGYVVEEMTQDDWDVAYSKAYQNLEDYLAEGESVIFDGGSLLRSERTTLKKYC